MSEKIPNAIKNIAKEAACNSIQFEGEYKGRKVYSLGNVDDNGLLIPEGLPLLVLWDGVKSEIVSGINSFKILENI